MEITSEESSWNKQSKKNISNKYLREFEKFGISNRSLFFPGKKQNVRFNVIQEIGVKPSDSILDVGCGFGDLFKFLKESMGFNGLYSGIDIIPEFIAACRELFPEQDFRVLDIMQDEVNQLWDWVVLSGTLNIKIGDGHEDFVKSMISRMFVLSQKGVSMDFVSIYGDARYDYIYRANPGEIIDFCRSLSKRIIVRMDYLPYEFSIYLYKDDSETSDKIFSQYSFPEFISY
jgi:SAM-dependent methyltransferase